MKKKSCIAALALVLALPALAEDKDQKKNKKEVDQFNPRILIVQ